MEPGWLRARQVALTSAAFTLGAIACQVAESMLRANEPAPHPENPFPLFPSDTDLAALAIWVLQFVVALLGATIGIAAIARRPGRILGAVSAAVSLLVLVV